MQVSRVIPFALGALLFPLVAGAQDDGVPAIFSDAPRPTPLKLLAPAIVRAPLPLSPQIRAAMTERVAVSIAHLPAAPKTPKRTWWESNGDAVMMDPFFVNARREKKIEVVSVPTYLVKVLTTGRIWTSKDQDTTINWGVRENEATGYGARTTVPGFSLSITKSW